MTRKQLESKARSLDKELSDLDYRLGQSLNTLTNLWMEVWRLNRITGDMIGRKYTRKISKELKQNATE